MSIPSGLEKRGVLFWTAAGLAGIAAIGVVDVVTGREFGLSPFYLIPIVFVTWFAGRNLGLAMSVVGAGMWLAADAIDGQVYSQPVVRYWNAAVRLSFFVVVTLLLPALKALDRERELARIDSLTGAANRRHFLEVAQIELDRAERYKRPFTVVYIDLDHFKAVNDRQGHRAGDQVLRAVVDRARRQLRKTDFLARWGGDEFVVLLRETDQDAARAAIAELQAALLDEMRRQDWPVTFSIGAVTCRDAHTPPWMRSFARPTT